MKNILNRLLRSLFSFFGSIFVGGLIALLPITLTIGLFGLSFKILKNWLRPLYLLEPEWLQSIPFSEFLLALMVIIIVGFIINIIFLRTIFQSVETFINNIPLVRPVYTGFKQLMQAFSPTDKHSFKQVVIIEFPRKGAYSIGFVTSTLAKQLAPDEQQTYYSVFIPTAPMPTNGFFLIVSEHDVKTINISRQEAMALIISGGIVQPERFNGS